LISLIIHNNIENITLDGKIYSLYSIHAVMGFVISHLAGPTMPDQLPFLEAIMFVCVSQLLIFCGQEM